MSHAGAARRQRIGDPLLQMCVTFQEDWMKVVEQEQL
jgi:hypothetical protein